MIVHFILKVFCVVKVYIHPQVPPTIHHLYHNSKITTEKEWTIYDWCEERLEIQCIADDILSKYVPPHVNIFYCFGGIVSCMLLLQVVL